MFVGGRLLSESVAGSGSLVFLSATEGATEGAYHLRVRVNPVAGLAFTLDAEEPLWPRTDGLPLVPLVPGYLKFLYLPPAVRGY